RPTARVIPSRQDGLLRHRFSIEVPRCLSRHSPTSNSTARRVARSSRFNKTFGKRLGHRARLGRHAERIRDSEHARRLRDRACAHRAGDRGPDQHHSHLDAVHGVCWRLRRARRSLGLRLMGDPVFVQFPFVGGLDEKTAATYLDPDQNQASILNGSFRYVGRVDKRFGIQYDKELGACAVLNPSGVADPYVAPSFYATALGGLGVQILQGPWAWVEQAGTVAYAGKRPNFAAVRRPLPARSIAVPLIC